MFICEHKKPIFHPSLSTNCLDHREDVWRGIHQGAACWEGCRDGTGKDLCEWSELWEQKMREEILKME